MSLHVEMERWEDAFLLGRQSKELLEIAKLPYANFLLKNDRYEEVILFVYIGTQSIQESRPIRSNPKNACDFGHQCGF